VATVVEPDVTTYQQYIDGEWIGADLDGHATQLTFGTPGARAKPHPDAQS